LRRTALIVAVALLPALLPAVGAAARTGQRPQATAVLHTSGGARYPWRERARKARRYARRRLGRVSFAVVGEHDRLRGFHVRRTFRSASTIKVMFMTAYLRQRGVRHRRLRRSDKALLKPMITRSDNTTATIIFNRVGRRRLRRLARAAGMRDFRPSIVWGLSRISARDEARFMRHLRRYIPARHRAYAFHLLSHIVSWQRWGMPGAQPRGWNIYFKGGFVRGPVGWVTHQIALLRHRRHRLGIAVLTYSPTLGYGAKTIHGVTRRLVGNAAPRR
jgi:Beta-lactamase enzyme family